MSGKIITTKKIRQQLEKLHQRNYAQDKVKPKHLYKGLGLNWRGVTVFILLLIHVSLYQINA